jgi:protein-arginine kinase activator protein McsA
LNKDISELIKDWEYDPAIVNARHILGADGTRRIQLRMDLGILQLEMTGRPDGTRPRGYDTLLDYFKLEAGTSNGRLKLNADDCSELQQEATQFYYRYIASLSLKDYDTVVRDTQHNLELFEFVEAHTEDAGMSWEFTQYKPYLLMMQTRALAESASARKDFEETFCAAMRGLEEIWTFWDEQAEPVFKTDSHEVEVLTRLLETYINETPLSEADELREKLHYAIKAENYERAAKLRDELQALSEPSAEQPIV